MLKQNATCSKQVHDLRMTLEEVMHLRYLGPPHQVTSARAHLVCPSRNMIITLMSFIFYLINATSAMSISTFDVPPYQVAGTPVKLKCHYRPDNGEELYSVKWYWNLKEFYRFIPSNNPKIQIFDLAGVSVDTALSDANSVFLRSVSLQSSGEYRCEVSADSPSFHTVSKSAEMLVVDLPDQEPQITGGEERFHVGDEVYVNCTSAKSRPAASLMWYINGRQAKMENIIEHAPQQDKDGLETSRLGLNFTATPRHFPNGVLNLRCTATIAAVYWQSSESVIKGNPPQKGPALESKRIYSGSSTMPIPKSGLTLACLCLMMSTLL